MTKVILAKTKKPFNQLYLPMPVPQENVSLFVSFTIILNLASSKKPSADKFTTASGSSIPVTPDDQKLVA
jgi:hypothetical protein|tara:strand:+ start:550 stop:759 length:210 start_codon:yes stop_codon:yes gene_type:complete